MLRRMEPLKTLPNRWPPVRFLAFLCSPFSSNPVRNIVNSHHTGENQTKHTICFRFGQKSGFSDRSVLEWRRNFNRFDLVSCLPRSPPCPCSTNIHVFPQHLCSAVCQISTSSSRLSMTCRSCWHLRFSFFQSKSCCAFLIASTSLGTFCVVLLLQILVVLLPWSYAQFCSGNPWWSRPWNFETSASCDRRQSPPRRLISFVYEIFPALAVLARFFQKLLH